MLFNRCLVYLKYSCSKKRAKNVQKRAKTCKNVHLKYSFYQKRASQVLIYQKTCKNVYLKRKISKNVLLKYFWTQFKNVHLRGPCSLRPCISRPYCMHSFILCCQMSNLRGTCFQNLMAFSHYLNKSL